MDSQKFTEAYPDELTFAQMHSDRYAYYIHDAQERSHEWGRVLHGLLSGERAVEPRPAEYARWFAGDFTNLVRGLQDAPVEVQAELLNEINFHPMNNSALPLWQPLDEGRWRSPNHRAQVINGVQFDFAYRGLEMYTRRQAMVNRHGSHMLFDPKYRALHKSMTGVMQECDAGIILLDFIRKQPNMVVLPAPMQFERSRGVDKNVDFVVADFVDHRAIGVQVKSKLRREEVDNADPERVVFIDGDVDLGNVKFVRKRKDSSAEALIPWPGIIATKKMASFRAHGRSVRQFSHSPSLKRTIAADPKVLVQLQFLSHELLGNTRVDYDHIVSIIGNRILQKM